MGLLLARGSAADFELPQGLRNGLLGEEEAHASEPIRVLGCPRCHRRLCTLGRDSSNSSGSVAWKVPANRVEKFWLGGGSFLGCRACGRGQLDVKVLSDSAKLGGGGPDLRLVSLRSSPGASVRAGFRPFSACVCGTYESVVARGARLLRADAVTSGRTVHVVEKTLKRSELAKLSEDHLPPPPIDLFLVVHKISGARNPITDAHGLFNDLIARAWSRADVVLLCLFDMPNYEYFSIMLKEQPTLLALMGAGRLLPLFLASGDATGGSQEDSVGVSENGSSADADGDQASESAEAAWWILRCLDGRVPRVEAFSEAQQAAISGSADAQSRAAAQRGATEAASDSSSSGTGGSRRRQPSTGTSVDATEGGLGASCASLVALTPVVEAFKGRPLVQD